MCVFCVCVACDVSRNVFVCSVLYRVAAYGSVLHFAAARCSALQRVAVRCSCGRDTAQSLPTPLQCVHTHPSAMRACAPSTLFPPPPLLTHTNPSNSLPHSHTFLSHTLTHTHSPLAQYTLSLDTMCPTHSNTLQHTATHCNTINTPQHTATHRNTSQHTASHCNTLSPQTQRI